MPGEEQERHVGTLGVFLEVLQRAAGAFQVAVGFDEDLEIKALQHLFQRTGVVQGVLQRADEVIVLGGQQEGHALFCQCGGEAAQP